MTATAGAYEEPTTLAGRDKRRPRWWLRILSTVLVLGLLVAGVEVALRAIIPGIIATSIRDSFGLSPEQPITVQLQGSALVPALSGRVGQVNVTVPNVEVLDGIYATLEASADSVPFDPTSGTIEGGTASVSVSSRSFGQVVSLATNGFVSIGEIVGNQVRVGTELGLFGFDVPFTALLALSISDGDLLVEPTSVQATGFDFSVEELRNLTSGPIAELLSPHRICVSDRIPRGITLTDITVQERFVAPQARLTLSVALAPDVLSNPAQLEMGSCENAAGLDLIG